MQPGQYRDLARSVNDPKRQGKTGSPSGVTDIFVARIKSGAVLLSGSTNRWRYTWEEVVVKDDNAVVATATRRANGTDASTYAINLCEMCQQPGGATKVGPGVTISSIPAGYAVAPIAENTCVLMHAMQRASGKQLFCFSMPNAIDGSCA
jgi:hypothetical protein